VILQGLDMVIYPQKELPGLFGPPVGGGMAYFQVGFFTRRGELRQEALIILEKLLERAFRFFYTLLKMGR
jgi:hypothetical protein